MEKLVLQTVTGELHSKAGHELAHTNNEAVVQNERENHRTVARKVKEP